MNFPRIAVLLWFTASSLAMVSQYLKQQVSGVTLVIGLIINIGMVVCTVSI